MTKPSPAVWARYWQFIRREWVWLGCITLLVSGVVLFTLFVDPRYHAVWMYTPQAIPTLSFVEAVLTHQSVQVPSNHATWLGVWVLSLILTTPAGIVTVLYLIASISTALAAYVMFRVRTIAVTWAFIGAIAFGLLPARFEMHNLSTHWWFVVPVIMGWCLWWWDSELRYRDAFVLPTQIYMAVTSLLLGLFGATFWLWSSVVLLTSAMIAALTYRTWRPIWWASGMSGVAWIVMTLLNQIWPIPRMESDNGLRLSSLWIPPADHRFGWFAQRGLDFDTLDIVHTDASYIGVLALSGLCVLVAHALVRSVRAEQVTERHRLMGVVGVVVVIANQRGLLLLAPFVGLPALSTMYVDVWIAFIGITVLVSMLNERIFHPNTRWVGVLVGIVVLVDHVPQTNMLYQMMQRQIEIPVSHSWRDGVWLGQALQANDVVSITGVSDIEQGYGRWSDASKAEYIEITLAQSVTAPIILDIRARGVGVNIGAPVLVQIGDAQQSIILTDAVNSYQLTFATASGNSIRIYPQPVTEPPTGDVRRIGVLLQSIRVVHP